MAIIQNNSNSFIGWLVFKLLLWTNYIKGTLSNEEALIKTHLQDRRTKTYKNRVPHYLFEKFQVEQSQLSQDPSIIFDTYKIQPINGTQSDRVFVYFHGGGYMMEIDSYHWAFCASLVNDFKCTVIVPLYPLAPEYSYLDTHSALERLYEKLITKYDPKSITFMGDSAGGNLSLTMAQLVRDKGMPQPSNIVLLSPWFDLAMENKDQYALEKYDPIDSIAGCTTFGLWWSKGNDPSTLNPGNNDLSNLAPVSMFCGGIELFTPENYRIYKILEKTGNKPTLIEFKNMGHIFMLLPLPESKLCYSLIKDILNKCNVNDLKIKA